MAPGFLDDLCATLVVRRHHTDFFERDELWPAPRFQDAHWKTIGIILTLRAEGVGRAGGGISIRRSRAGRRSASAKRSRAPSSERQRRDCACGITYARTAAPWGNRDVALERLGEWLERGLLPRAWPVPQIMDRQNGSTTISMTFGRKARARSCQLSCC